MLQKLFFLLTALIFAVSPLSANVVPERNPVEIKIVNSNAPDSRVAVVLNGVKKYSMYIKYFDYKYHRITTLHHESKTINEDTLKFVRPVIFKDAGKYLITVHADGKIWSEEVNIKD